MAVSIESGITTANAVDIITFTTYYPKIEVVNRGSSELWVRANGTDPTIGGDDCEVIPAHSYKDNIRNQNLSNTEVRIISSDAIAYTVEGIS